jgi:hypothetical protein
MHAKYITNLFWGQVNSARRFGNGKRHRTPSPVGLRKIKRVSFKVFCALKELVNSVKVNDLIPTRRDQKKSVLRRKKLGLVQQSHVNEYEPSTTINMFSSPPWQWHRIAEWDRYINNAE